MTGVQTCALPIYDMTEKKIDPDTPQPLLEKEADKQKKETKIEPTFKSSKNEQKIDSKKEETGKLKAILIVGIALIFLLAGSGITAYFFLTGGK